MSFVIFWNCGRKAYITNRSPNRKPYASTANDPDTKVWKTRAAALKFLSRKDPLYASNCTIEEIGP